MRLTITYGVFIRLMVKGLLLTELAHQVFNRIASFCDVLLSVSPQSPPEEEKMVIIVSFY